MVQRTREGIGSAACLADEPFVRAALGLAMRPLPRSMFMRRLAFAAALFAALGLVAGGTIAATRASRAAPEVAPILTTAEAHDGFSFARPVVARAPSRARSRSRCEAHRMTEWRRRYPAAAGCAMTGAARPRRRDGAPSTATARLESSRSATRRAGRSPDDGPRAAVRGRPPLSQWRGAASRSARTGADAASRNG